MKLYRPSDGMPHGDSRLKAGSIWLLASAFLSKIISCRNKEKTRLELDACLPVFGHSVPSADCNNSYEQEKVKKFFATSKRFKTATFTFKARPVLDHSLCSKQIRT